MTTTPTTKITAQAILEAIEPSLAAERKALAKGEGSWDLPEFSTARELTEAAGCVWDFESWEETARTVRAHGVLGGVLLGAISDYEDVIRITEDVEDHEAIAHYTSEPYTVFGPDEDGHQTTVETTCTVDVYICGDAAHGYAFRTSDDADGPSDELGRQVYRTREEAMEALSTLISAKDGGWVEIV